MDESVVDGVARHLPDIAWIELFTRRAAAAPTRTALVADGTAWTFHDLDLWSNRLARALPGAGPGTVVACALPRSARAILALLAVAKTGAAYLPVDPTQPTARTAAILADAQPVTTLDEWPDLAPYDADPLPSPPATGPAYVIYTSGSTGRPKGVVVGNRSLVNLYHELAAEFFPSAPRRVAHGLPLSFDASWNPLLWLVGGHEVHLVPDDVRADPERYVRFVRDHRVSVVEAVPAHMTALVDAGLLDTRPELLLMGGEAVSQSLWSRLRAVDAVNLYGPTECTVFTTACRLSTRDTPAIGRPIGNTRVAVVDADLRPVPVGEPGELLVGGDCLALGYLGGGFTGAYRTGDRCRLDPDGNLEWLGRLDDQVKIRGHRVEPGEVEHALLALPGVRQAAVRVEGAGHTRRLAAYVVLDSGTADTVRACLERVLPDYLVPAVVPLDALPLGPHGKLDRPAMLTPAQEIVAALVRGLLENVVVTARSDFFALGGNSLSAAVLAARLRAAGVPCSLRDVLRLRTVARIAELVPEGRTP